VDWWGLYHRLMRELPWATPSAIGQLTIPQLACLGAEKPPGDPKGTGSQDEFTAFLKRRAIEEAAWNR
jgi:hypothetical protein